MIEKIAELKNAKRSLLIKLSRESDEVAATEIQQQIEAIAEEIRTLTTQGDIDPQVIALL